jgi:hypothetical protein
VAYSLGVGRERGLRQRLTSAYEHGREKDPGLLVRVRAIVQVAFHGPFLGAKVVGADLLSVGWVDLTTAAVKVLGRPAGARP